MLMSKNTIIIIAVVAVLAIGGAVWGFLGRKAAENTIESAIENSTNGSADVDLDNNTVTINTNAGTFQTGESVTLPSSFPGDVHVTDGTLVSATSVTENSGYSVMVQSTASVDSVKAEYEREFTADGWTSQASLSYSGSVTLSYEKENRTATVTISEADGKTSVILTTATSD